MLWFACDAGGDMQFHTYLAGLFGLTDNEWGRAIAQNLIASLIFAVAAFFATRAIYRARLTDKDSEIEKARLGEQKALRKLEALKTDYDTLKHAADDLAAASIETAFAAYEREERDGNYERAAGVLQEYFERERRNLARLTGTLGDWYAAFIGDENAAGAVERARNFYNIALFADPSDGKWPKAAAELSMAASIAKLQAGALPGGRFRRPLRLCHGEQPGGCGGARCRPFRTLRRDGGGRRLLCGLPSGAPRLSRG